MHLVFMGRNTFRFHTKCSRIVNECLGVLMLAFDQVDVQLLVVGSREISKDLNKNLKYDKHERQYIDSHLSPFEQHTY